MTKVRAFKTLLDTSSYLCPAFLMVSLPVQNLFQEPR